MNREIKFRAWDKENKFMLKIFDSVTQEAWFIPQWKDRYEVMQFTGLKDKKGVDVYEDDVLKIRKAERGEQTHTGDNIPLGSYTEPLEPIINESLGRVIFDDGQFLIEQDEDISGYDCFFPVSVVMEWANIKDEESLRRSFSGSWDKLNSAEYWAEDLQYLFEEYKLSSVGELLEYVGVEVIGNIFENPELLEKST